MNVGSMPIHAGKQVYSFLRGACSASGVSWTEVGLDAAIAEVAASILYDDPARALIGRILSDLPETGFDRTGTERAFSDMKRLENWRVGEFLAGRYLTAHRACSFPWPAEWDQKTMGSSLPGAELVGFCLDASGECFAFGEVKTSSDSDQPPRVMRGPDGLVRQLRNLRDRKAAREMLVLYLARRAARDSALCVQFQSAWERYSRDDLDVRLFGCLIRDVQPSVTDLRAAADQLGKGRPQAGLIELLAIYLPKNRISRLGHDVTEAMRGARP